jgi:hypothetical protein
MTLSRAIGNFGPQVGLTQLIDSRDLMRLSTYLAPITNACVILFINKYFRLKPTRAAPLAVLVSGLAWAVLSSTPLASYPAHLALEVLQLGLTWLYVAVTLGRLAREPEHRLEALCLLGAYVLVVVAGLTTEFGLVYAEAVPVAFAILTVTQAVLLLRNHARKMRDLNVVLEDRVNALEARTRDVSLLNEELRRQIHDRSARLADALGRIGRLSSKKTQALTVGTVIGERYRIVATLGQGGMGAVYEVERTTDGTHFALKTLLQADSGAWLARLAREAQAATAIMHPNVVNVVDIDVDISGIPFLVMELVKGEPLSAKKARFGDPVFAREVVRQVAAGLSALHQVGIVHRDLKPQNVLLEPKPGESFLVKIVDFGIARVSTGPQPEAPGGVLDTDGFMQFVQGEMSESIDAAAATATPPSGGAQPVAALTGTGWLLGTPLYMAPELARGVKDAPPSCDLWSLGVVAYQIGCGKMPFHEPPVNWMGRGEQPPQAIDASGLAEPLKGVVERCLAADPERRPTAAEVAAVLA